MRESPEPRPAQPLDQPPRRAARGMWLSDLSIRQPVFIAMLVLAVAVVGSLSYTRLGLELFPDIALPVAVVQTVYPGASPQEVESSVTRPLEDAVASLNGVESVRSVSLAGASLVVVEFDMARDGKAAADDVQARVDLARAALPADAQAPTVQRFDFSAAPVLSLAIADASGQRSPQQLRALVEDTLQPRLERVDGVAAVTVAGGQVEQVNVDLSLAQLQAHGIPPEAVVQAIRAQNLDVPAGQLTAGQRLELLKTAGELRSLDQLGDLPVAVRPNDVVIRVRNLADVAEGPADAQTISRLDGQDSVVASVQKQSGGNSVRVADAVKAELAKLEGEYPDLRFAVAYDESTYTRESVEDVQSSLLIGALLAALVVLAFFRDLRNTLVTVAGLPVILLGTFSAMRALGLSLNLLTLMALSLSVGMLIDDAIVVRENIFRRTEAGEEPGLAASRGTAEIALAVVAVTSTIVAVFLPIAFTSGLAGVFLRDFGLTVAVAVLISLAEALTLAPMLSAHFFRRRDRGSARREAGAGAGLPGLTGGYRRLLGWSLRHRLVVVLVGALALGGALAIVPRMTVSFAPASDRGEFGVALALAPGARLADTDAAARAVEGALRAEPEVGHVFATVGSSDGAVESATLQVQLHERGHTAAFVERVRPRLAQAAGGAKLTIDQQANDALMGNQSAVGAVQGRPIQFSVQGDDFAQLDQVSAVLVERLQRVPGLVDVDRSIKPTRPGQAIVVDPAKAAGDGLTTAQVGATVRALVTGERAGTYHAGDRDLDVVVRLAASDRGNLADVLSLPIVTPRGGQVKLSEVAGLAATAEPSQIDRADRQRQVIVGGGYQGRSPGAVLADARAAAAAIPLPPGVTIKVSGQAKSQDEMLSSLGLAFGLSVLFVYTILASQFGSFVHPLTIMLALPFSIVGALLALFVGGFELDMLGIIGMILLMGLVSKNSILLVEFVNQLRRQGRETREAILEAGPIRLRPILMTTLAMVFGMAPVAAGVGAGSELRRPMGVAVIGGLLTSTLLTLVVVPVAYSLIDDAGGWLGRVVARGGAPEEGPAHPRTARAGALRRLAVAGCVVALLGAGLTYRATSARTSPAGAQPPTVAPPAPAATPEPGVQLAVVSPVPAAAPQVPSLPPEPPASTPPGPAGQLAAAAPAPPGPPAPGGRIAVANTDGLGANLRAGPTTGAAGLGALPEGAPLSRLGEATDSGGRAWVKVQTPGGAVGWVAKDYLAGEP